MGGSETVTMSQRPGNFITHIQDESYERKYNLQNFNHTTLNFRVVLASSKKEVIKEGRQFPQKTVIVNGIKQSRWAVSKYIYGV